MDVLPESFAGWDRGEQIALILGAASIAAVAAAVLASILCRTVITLLRGYPPPPPPEPPSPPEPEESLEESCLKQYRQAVDQIMKRCCQACPNCGEEATCDIDPAPSIREFNAGMKIIDQLSRDDSPVAEPVKES